MSGNPEIEERRIGKILVSHELMQHAETMSEIYSTLKFSIVSKEQNGDEECVVIGTSPFFDVVIGDGVPLYDIGFEKNEGGVVVGHIVNVDAT